MGSVKCSSDAGAGGCGSCCSGCADGNGDVKKSGIRRTVIVLSGKGGVGKSTVALNLAVAMSLEGFRVGLLDIDIHGPSIPLMLGLEDKVMMSSNGLMEPLTAGNLKVMSIGFLLQDKNDAVIWRGPMKAGVIEQFLKEVNWGDLDCLIVDSPPGTGDEPLSICQNAGASSEGLIVTTPQEVSSADVRKSINFCRKVQLPIIGIIENMSGFVCPDCCRITHIFSSGGGQKLAHDNGVSFLGSIPLDPEIGICGDMGKPYIHRFSDSPVSALFRKISQDILDSPLASERCASGDIHRKKSEFK
ncbi:MAG: ATP-binding protein [Candidatus Wallbacteria bacterium HGW-Wallbacteria-1]|jgi:Mrp family chromosome partitioning ATPase|uniref:Iron-sulfur cluster carrier protein n=1 Tax=Candidatus Wallbacteria bacterium HGW-Wallbacteria-1 TaxID=2013854 RepID=A0A2N1PL92_9BACT|nr:MAG: ATP-binding protein [Candidatus Wallbacteria bacterium HGW-Wallbacteria-1]